MQKLSLAVKNFNERVKVMNQTGGKQLSLSAEEARNLHADIFNLLANIAELQSRPESAQSSAATSLDGGGFLT
jgi:hypothetical protein